MATPLKNNNMFSIICTSREL